MESIAYMDIFEVMALVKLKRTAIYRRIGEGVFPKPRKSKSGKRVLWVRSEVQSWLDDDFALPQAA